MIPVTKPAETPVLLVGRVVGKLGHDRVTIELEHTREIVTAALAPSPRIGCTAKLQVDNGEARLVEFTTTRETVAIAVTPRGRKRGAAA